MVSFHKTDTNMSMTDENPFSFLLRRKEDNGNYSVVGLAEHAISKKTEDSIFDYLQGLQFRGGDTSFGAIPREQLWFNLCGEEFGRRAGWKDSENMRWKSCAFDEYLLKVCGIIQAKFNDYMLDAIPGVQCAVFDSLLANKYIGPRSSIKPHRDSEEVFGDNPSVMILSVGCPREIIFKRIIYNQKKLKSIKNDKIFGGCREFKIMLPSGSILFMGGETQKYYSHEIQKVDTDSLVDDEDVRYSLTFRQYE
jgi:hypothetical protein